MEPRLTRHSRSSVVSNLNVKNTNSQNSEETAIKASIPQSATAPDQAALPHLSPSPANTNLTSARRRPTYSNRPDTITYPRSKYTTEEINNFLNRNRISKFGNTLFDGGIFQSVLLSNVYQKDNKPVNLPTKEEQTLLNDYLIKKIRENINSKHGSIERFVRQNEKYFPLNNFLSHINRLLTPDNQNLLRDINHINFIVCYIDYEKNSDYPESRAHKLLDIFYRDDCHEENHGMIEASLMQLELKSMLREHGFFPSYSNMYSKFDFNKYIPAYTKSGGLGFNAILYNAFHGLGIYEMAEKTASLPHNGIYKFKEQYHLFPWLVHDLDHLSHLEKRSLPNTCMESLKDIFLYLIDPDCPMPVEDRKQDIYCIFDFIYERTRDNFDNYEESCDDYFSSWNNCADPKKVLKSLGYKFNESDSDEAQFESIKNYMRIIHANFIYRHRPHIQQKIDIIPNKFKYFFEHQAINDPDHSSGNTNDVDYDASSEDSSSDSE